MLDGNTTGGKEKLAVKLWSRVLAGSNDGAVAILALTGMLVCTDVILRNVFSVYFKGTYAYVELVLGAILFLPLARVQQLGRQIHIEVVSQHFRGKVAKLMEILYCLVGGLFFGAILWYGSLDWVWSLRMGEVTGDVGVPMAIPRGLLLLGAALIWGELLRGMMRVFFSKRTGRQAEESGNRER